MLRQFLFLANQYKGRLVQFLKELPVCSYTNIGTELGLHKTYQPSNKPLHCLRDLFPLWLRSKRKDCTWGNLVNGLETVDQHDIARKVTEDHSKEGIYLCLYVHMY